MVLITGLETIALVLISGTSMLPTYHDGDLVFRYLSDVPGHTFEDVKVGDIVVVDSPRGVVVHRVIDIEEDEDNERFLILKGDNNDNPIEDVDFPIYQDDFRGIVVQ